MFCVDVRMIFLHCAPNYKFEKRYSMKLRHAIRNTITSVLPRNRVADKFVSFLWFVIAHKRLPSDALLFNDYFYRIKSTNEILDPLRVFVSDKELVKIYVKAKVGDQYNVPTIGVIHDINQVDAYEFPADCCIKPTHMSNAVILRRNNAEVDRDYIKSWFPKNFYDVHREANYRYLKPKVIIEPIIYDGEHIEDYKFFCFNGEPKLLQIDIGRHVEHKRLLIDMDWNIQDYSIARPKADIAFPKPDNFEEMKEVARALAKDFSFVRVDLYSNGKTCMLGEITNCHGSALEAFIPKSAEKAASKIIFG